MILLCGCTDDDAMEQALELRSKLLSSGCSFRAAVSADYGDYIQCFVMDCDADESGNVTFAVVDPDTISGITGKLSGEKGFLTFEDELLAFSMLTEDQISPVSAPWILVNSLRSGYLRSCGKLDSGYRLTIDDSYADRAMQVDIWLNDDGKPQGAEILWQGRRILTINIENFVFL